MPRPLRDQSGGFVHLTWRGNRRQPIFDDDVDRAHFLELLAAVCEKRGWRVLAWCLMGNHVHLLVEVPAGTLSRGMQWLGGRYAQLYNVRHGLDGHLFQGRFHSERVADLEHAVEAGRYIDLNPERAGMCRADEWRWSSHRAHVGLEPPRPFHDAEWLPRSFGAEPSERHAGYADFVDAARRRPRPRPATRLAMSRRDMSRGLTPGHGRFGHVPEVEDQPP
ncbi:MAG TPA: transposase [Gaiellaceae bacterium]|nr:transposase [Gaiellaceae bacterium]